MDLKDHLVLFLVIQLFVRIFQSNLAVFFLGFTMARKNWTEVTEGIRKRERFDS